MGDRNLLSGRLLLRIPRGLHSELSQEAREQGVSLNQYVSALLAGASGWRPADQLSQAPMGRPGYMPDHGRERREEYRQTSPAERLAEAISLSRTATMLAAAGAAARRKRG